MEIMKKRKTKKNTITIIITRICSKTIVVFIIIIKR